jgi:hypothetical protein
MSYVKLAEETSSLHIRLTEAGFQELQSQRDDMGWKRGTLYILLDLLEDWLCNGWEWVKPEDIGALTSAPILRSPRGTLYWFPAYAITCEIEEMLANGEVVFSRAS